MSTSGDAIKRVIEAFERSDWSEIDVRSGDVRVHLVAAGTQPGSDPGSDPGSGAAKTAAAAAPPLTPEHHDHAAAAGVESARDAHVAPIDAHLVVTPSPGVFWRAPEPGLPPFVDVGDVVDASATVCIIEVMKLMNHLKAGVSGTVVAVYGRNGEAVGKGEAMFAISPSGPT